MEARKEGIRDHCPLALAQALAPHAFIEKHNPERDYASLYKLAQWAIRFSPYVGIDAKSADATAFDYTAFDYGITLNSSGTERCHGGDTLLAEKILSSFAAYGFYAKVAIAPTLGAAWALSRYSKERISFLDPFYYPLTELPVQALRIPEDKASLLLQLGIKTIHELLLLPRNSLGDRFGEIVPKRLYQALGKVDEPFNSIPVPSSCTLRRKFEVPITSQQTLAHAVTRIFEELFAMLLKKHERALSFVLEFESINNDRSISILRKELSLFRAQDSLRAIRNIIDALCEKIVSPQGIQSIMAQALSPESIRGSSGNLFSAEFDMTARQGEELLNTLLLRLGREHVRKLHCFASHVPERSFRYDAISSTDNSENTHLPLQNLPRPSYLLSRPEPLRAIALLPDHPPSRMYWNGEELTIVRGIGPERICDEWWRHVLDDEIREREYFRVQESSGRWLWVFRKRRTMQWFVHGVWS